MLIAEMYNSMNSLHIGNTNVCVRIMLTIKRLSFRVRVMPCSSFHSSLLTLDMIFNFLILFTFNFNVFSFSALISALLYLLALEGFFQWFICSFLSVELNRPMHENEIKLFHANFHVRSTNEIEVKIKMKWKWNEFLTYLLMLYWCK